MYIIAVVYTFGIENPIGKKVYIYDHLNTRVDDEDTLRFLLNGNKESLVLKVNFIGDIDCQDVVITSEVRFILYHSKLM